MGSKKKNSKNKVPMIPKNDDTTRGTDSFGGKNVMITTDPRFESVQLDPRFAKLPKHKAKVTIDSRFNHMFIDKKFSLSTSKIDKRGKAKKDTSRATLKHYYKLEEEHKEQKLKGKEQAESDEGEVKSEPDREKSGVDLSDLEPETDSDEKDGDSNCGSSADTEEEEGDEYGLSSAEEEDTFVQEENVPKIDKETHRLAVVNLDWGRVKAVDLYVLLGSFLPKGGQILSVSVYPSEFGLHRMKEEERHGPVGLFDDEKDKIGSDDEDNHDNDNDDDDDDDDDEIDNEKLRSYERSRLRYYFAVVECDSIATADYLYKTCDGVEFERSSNKLDLRFIPESMEFNHPPRDVAKEAPADYEGLDFQTRALQLSKIDLTWDEDEPQRTKLLKRKFNSEQLADLEMKEFLASDESETDEDENIETTGRSENNKKNMYRALLQSAEGSNEGDEDAGQDMEVTFNTGLEDLSKRILEKKDKDSETVWEHHRKKMKEKNKARKNRSKNSSDESDEDHDEAVEEIDDFFINESSTKGKRKQKEKKNMEVDKEEEEKNKAELELLLAGENGADAGVKGYNMKRRKVKGKKGKEVQDEGKIPNIDYEDPRFLSLFKSPLFALDPTDPQFKRSAAYVRQLTQKQLGEDEEPITKEHGILASPVKLGSDDVAMGKKEKKDKHELSSLVKSIKMKSKQVHLPSNGKLSREAAKSRKKPRV